MKNTALDSNDYKRKKTFDRITVDDLKYYIPIFHIGDAAEEILLTNDSLSENNRNLLESKARLKDMAVKKIAELSGPLITFELNKIIKNSHLNGKEDLYNILYYAGIDGMIKGLRHFEVEKINKSSTNYIFQWITTYAKKELSTLEAPFGIAPSRFAKYKKISAVRKKLSEQLERYATNEEVLEYFHSGQADIKNMNGKVANQNEPSKANREIKLSLIEEQEHYEQNLSTVNYVDPTLDYYGEINNETNIANETEQKFENTIMGVFVEQYNFTEKAIAVLVSNLKYSNVDSKILEKIFTITNTEYKQITKSWEKLFKDVNGPFYSFLKTADNDIFKELNINQTIKEIENYKEEIGIERYLTLFNNGRLEKNE